MASDSPSSNPSFSLPVTLNPPLSGREAVADAVYRALLGLDTNDAKLFESGLTEDVIFTVNESTTHGREALVSGSFAKLSKLDTTHFLTNVRVHIDEGGATASLTASALSQHYRGGEGMDPKAERYLAGTLYFLDLVRDDDEAGGIWRVKNWKIRTSWNEGNVAIVQ